MPNICFNRLRIVGRAEEIREIAEHKLSFQHFVPLDPLISDTDTLRESITERQQCLELWGVKWEPESVDITLQDENEIRLEFITPWNPPFAFLRNLLKRLPSCWIKLMWEVELGWGSGIWIRYNSAKSNEPCESEFCWQEPLAFPDKNGNIITPDESC